MLRIHGIPQTHLVWHTALFSTYTQNKGSHRLIIKHTPGSHIIVIQGGAGHLASPEQGKRAKIFFEKGLFQAQNRATKPDVKEFFDVEEHFNGKK